MAIQFTRGTLAQWTSSGKVLLDGQLGILRRADGSDEMRVGNGSDLWDDLPPISITPDQIFVDVRDFGAVGNGTADDTSAFSAAVTYAHTLNIAGIDAA